MTCNECRFFLKDQKPMLGGVCRRYPHREGVAHDDWCGEFSKIDAKFKDFPEFADVPVIKKADIEDFF